MDTWVIEKEREIMGKKGEKIKMGGMEKETAKESRITF